MFQNDFKTASRNLLDISYSLGLNIWACSILTFLWVQDKLSFDKFNPNADHLYRLTVEASGVKAAVVPPPLVYAVKTQIPSVKNEAKILSLQEIITVGTKKFDEIMFVEGFFQVTFSYSPIFYSSGRTW